VAICDAGARVTKGKPNLRLFVGVYPPEATARAMADLLAAHTLAEHRPTPPEQIHLTVQFIGDTPDAALDSVLESVERSASGIGAFDLTPRRLISLPDRGPPRLAALETDAPPALLELKRRLAHRLSAHVRQEPAARFLPHFTLCRFAKGARAEKLEERVELPEFPVDRVWVMRSVLRPDGAEHREMAVFALE